MLSLNLELDQNNSSTILDENFLQLIYLIPECPQGYTPVTEGLKVKCIPPRPFTPSKKTFLHKVMDLKLLLNQST